MAIGGRILLFLAALMMATPSGAQTPAPARPAPSGPIYAITYFEVAPAALAAATGLLRQAVGEAHKATGNVEFLVLRDTARPGRLAIAEAWRDKAALNAHGAAMKALSDKLQADLVAPFDVRRFWELSVGMPPSSVPNGAIYVLTHVDVFPAGKDEVAAMVKQLAEDSRKDKGALSFDALVWDGHANHFHLVEAWANRSAFDAHVLAQHTREFRAKLVPFEGALYDERLYEAVR